MQKCWRKLRVEIDTKFVMKEKEEESKA